MKNIFSKHPVLIITAVGLPAIAIVGFLVGWFFGGEPATDGRAAAPIVVIADATASDKPQEYTCSMHPQVRLTDPNAKCPICFMDLIPVREVSEDEGGERLMVMTQASMKLAEIQTTPVRRFFPEYVVRLFGEVDYDETRIASINAYFPGRLESLFVDYTGVAVKEGDHLAEIYSADLIATQEELRLAAKAVEQLTTTSELVRRSTIQTLEAARDKLRLWGLTADQINLIESGTDPLERLTIYSPIGGIVIHKNAVQGMYVKTGDPIYTVADLDHLWVQLEAYESQLPWIRFGQHVTFTVDSLPGQTFEGQVSFIAPIVDHTTRTVRVRVNVDNHDSRLKPGMFVRAVARSKIAGAGMVLADHLAGKWIGPMHPEIVKDGPGQCDICGMDLVPVEELGYTVVSADEPPLVIPASAPLITGTRAVVYVRVPEKDMPTFEGREVTLGPRAGEFYIVASGLSEGEDVVTNGVFKIDSAMQIAAKPSMMNPAGGATSQPSTEPLMVRDTLVASLTPVYTAYFSAQEALADDDFDAFKGAVVAMHGSLDRVDTDRADGALLTLWKRLEAQLRENEGHVEHIADIDEARSIFETYSTAMIELEERIGHAGSRDWYQSFCPMAFDNNGASWLARDAEISNPYFGDAMLRCGEVQQTFAPRALSENPTP